MVQVNRLVGIYIILRPLASYRPPHCAATYTNTYYVADSCYQLHAHTLQVHVILTVAGPMIVTSFLAAIWISLLVLFSGMPSAMIAIVLNCTITVT